MDFSNVSNGTGRKSCVKGEMIRFTPEKLPHWFLSRDKRSPLYFSILFAMVLMNPAG